MVDKGRKVRVAILQNVQAVVSVDGEVDSDRTILGLLLGDRANPNVRKIATVCGTERSWVSDSYLYFQEMLAETNNNILVLH